MNMYNQNKQRDDILQDDSKNKVLNPPCSIQSYKLAGTLDDISLCLSNASVEKLQDFDDEYISDILVLATHNTNITSPPFPLEICVLPSSYHKYIGKKTDVTRKETNFLLTVKLPDAFITPLSRSYPSIWLQLVEPTLGTPPPPQAGVVLKLALNITSSLRKQLPPLKELVGFAIKKKNRRTQSTCNRFSSI
eukprot:TRINITY_DN12059_c0_g1_i1.p1 TRINITY_DN12059_c0_g1~~TRINITY_DN12059_c0_g1_i1.p1  ORF type:complete len:192 (+),score=16.07 TRINITY_DN12059_c0_g1_i1:122-697(+)